MHVSSSAAFYSIFMWLICHAHDLMYGVGELHNNDNSFSAVNVHVFYTLGIQREIIKANNQGDVGRPGNSTTNNQGDVGRPGNSTTNNQGDVGRPGNSTTNNQGDVGRPGNSTMSLSFVTYGPPPPHVIKDCN